MARGKRAKLELTSASDRMARRQTVALPGKCTIGERDEEDVLVTDLAKQGCRMHTSAVGVTKTEILVLTLEGCEPITGALKWSKGGSVGVQFDEPLDPALLARLCEESAVTNVVPFRE